MAKTVALIAGAALGYLFSEQKKPAPSILAIPMSSCTEERGEAHYEHEVEERAQRQ